MCIQHTKVDCLSRQPRKSQPEISKLSERNDSQENYHSNMILFGCQPNTPIVKKNAIRVNWPRANDAKWKTLDEELSFILQTSLKGSIRVKLHSFTNIVHVVYLEHFGSEDQQLRFEQRCLKKLKEIPGDKTLIKQQLSKIKEKILVIS